MQSVFDAWLAEMAAEGVELPDDINAGARGNMWSLSFAAGRLPAANDLAHFVLQAVALRRSQVALLGAKPATFYLWHDSQAGQLRFSVARCRPDSLPFGCEVSPSATAEEIVDAFLSSGSCDGTILTSGSQDLLGSPDELAPEGDELCRLRVWSCSLA